MHVLIEGLEDHVERVVEEKLGTLLDLAEAAADARERAMQEPLVSRCTCGHVEEGPARECIAAMTRHLDRCKAKPPSDSR
jgi:hypothetical protein